MSVARALERQAQSWALHARGDLAAAAAACREALRLVEDSEGAVSLDAANLLNDLAAIERDRGQLADAMALAERARDISRLEHAAATEDITRVRFEALMLTGGLRRAQGPPSDAWIALSAALTMAIAAFGEPSEEVAVACNELGLLCKSCGRFDDGLRFYERARASMTVIHGERSLPVGAVVHNIGGLQHARGDYAAAEAPARLAWDISRHHLGDDNPKTMADAVAYAGVLDGLGRHDECERICRAGLSIFERALGPNHEEVAATLHNLGAALEKRDGLEEAEACYRRGLTIHEARGSSESGDAALTMNNLGRLLAMTGRLDEGRELLRRSLVLLERYSTDGHPALTRVRAHLRESKAVLAERTPLSAE